MVFVSFSAAPSHAATVLINGGAAATNNTGVTLSLSYPAYTVSLDVANEGGPPASFSPSPTLSWDLSPGDGIKTVNVTAYVQTPYQYQCGQYQCGTYPCGSYCCDWGMFGNCTGWCTNYCPQYCPQYCTGYNDTTESASDGIILDTLPPSVLGTSPAADAVSVPVGIATIYATFSEPMNGGTVNGATFTLDGGAAGSVSYDPGTRTGVFHVSGALGYATVYTATLTSGIRDAAGNALAGYSWQFSTENRPPEALDDAASTEEETAVAVDVLANDSDPDGQALAVTGVTQGAHGVVVTDGTLVTYTPQMRWSGEDTFTYTVGDGWGGSDTARVTVSVTPVEALDFDPGADGAVCALALQPDGKVLVGGLFATLGGEARNYLGRLLPSGALDGSFDPGADGEVLALALQPDGRILVGGAMLHMGGQTRTYLGRLNPDGSLDSSFDPAPDNGVTALALQPDGQILVGGMFAGIAGGVRNMIARLEPDGSLDGTFDPGADGTVYALALQADGKILVGGDFTALGGAPRSRIGRLNADGSLDAGFDPGADDVVFSLATQADGRILAAGAFTHLGGAERAYLGRLEADGSLDAGFDPGADYAVLALALQANGDILAGGQFAALGGEARERIGRLPNTAAASQGMALGAYGESVTWQRGGGGPEVWRATFEYSDDGVTWSWLGEGSRVAGGWELAGLALPYYRDFYLRARGYATGGLRMASCSLVEWVRACYLVDNRAPVLLPVGDRIVAEGSTLAFLVKATDVDGDALAFSASGLPAGATFDGDAGAFIWTPGHSQAGSYEITFSVTDDGVPNLSASETVTVTVTDANRPPVLEPVGDRTVTEYQALSFSLQAEDPDGDAVTYYSSALPDGASLDAVTGLFSWTPGGTQAGSWEVTFIAMDDGDPFLADVETVTISVVDHDSLVFSDDFGDGTAEGDPDWEEAAGGWGVSPLFTFVASAARANRALVQGVPQLESFAAGVAEARVKLPRTAVKAPNGGIMFHAADAANYRYARLVKAATGGKLVIGQVGDPAGDGSASFGRSRRLTVRSGRFYALGLKLWPDGLVEAFVDGVKVHEWAFPQAVAGRVGLTAAKSKSAFDDFAVYDWTALTP